MQSSSRTASRPIGIALIACTASCLYPPIPAEFEGGPDNDASIGVDGAEVIPEFNGCTTDRFVDRSASTAMRTVGFGGREGSDEFGFAPACITVAVGQTVHFSGDFSTHPLSPGIGPQGLTAGSAGNPILHTASGTALDVAFPVAGTYPYFCEMHVASDMAGVVHVR